MCLEKEKTICGETFYNVPKICAFMGGMIHAETVKSKIREKKLKAIKLNIANAFNDIFNSEFDFEGVQS